MYLERRIGAAVHGDSFFDFSAVIGWKHLGASLSTSNLCVRILTFGCTEDAVKEFGKDHGFTKLLIDHKGIDPDDAFSTVPYEKGFHMIYYLDRLVGRGNFDKFIPYYFNKFTNKSLDSFEFKDTFLDFFSAPEYASLKGKLAEIDWEGRYHNPGLPPKPDFDTSLIDVSYDLAGKWKSKVGPSSSPSAPAKCPC